MTTKQRRQYVSPSIRSQSLVEAFFTILEKSAKARGHKAHGPRREKLAKPKPTKPKPPCPECGGAFDPYNYEYDGYYHRAGCSRDWGMGDDV